jgi:hypothetical protein
MGIINIMGLTEENQTDTKLYKELDSLQNTSLFSSSDVDELKKEINYTSGECAGKGMDFGRTGD